jgi:hypothetical protein
MELHSLAPEAVAPRATEPAASEQLDRARRACLSRSVPLLAAGRDTFVDVLLEQPHAFHQTHEFSNGGVSLP